MTRAARAHGLATGAKGESGSSQPLPFLCCFNVVAVETVHVDFIAVFSRSHTTHPALNPCCAGAMPAINRAGKAAAPRQEETEQEGERGQSPRKGDCVFSLSKLPAKIHAPPPPPSSAVCVGSLIVLKAAARSAAKLTEQIDRDQFYRKMQTQSTLIMHPNELCS
jgi:hypothetical protein